MTNEELKKKIMEVIDNSVDDWATRDKRGRIHVHIERIADALIAAGYRKQSDVAREFAEGVKALLNKYEYRSNTDGVSFYQMNAESFCDKLNELAAEFGAEVDK